MNKQKDNNIISFLEIREKNEIIEKELKKFLKLKKRDKFEKLKNGLFYVEKNKKQYIIKIYETSDYKTNNKSSLRIQASNSYFEFINSSIRNNQIPICLPYYYENNDIIFYNIPLEEMLKSKDTHSKSYPIRKEFLSRVIENKNNYNENFYEYIETKTQILKYRYTTNIDLLLKESENEAREYLFKNKKTKKLLEEKMEDEDFCGLLQHIIQGYHNYNSKKEIKDYINIKDRDGEIIINKLFTRLGCTVLDYATKRLGYDSLIDNVAFSIKTKVNDNKSMKIHEQSALIHSLKEIKDKTTKEGKKRIIELSVEKFNDRLKEEFEQTLMTSQEFLGFILCEDTIRIFNEEIKPIDINKVMIEDTSYEETTNKKGKKCSSIKFRDDKFNYTLRISNNTLMMDYRALNVALEIPIVNHKNYENLCDELIVEYDNVKNTTKLKKAK